MKKYKANILKKESGITLVALLTTIIVIAIITAPILIYTTNVTDYRRFAKFKNDTLNLKEAIIDVYGTEKDFTTNNKSDAMYIGDKYTAIDDFLNTVKNNNQGDNAILNPNDDNNYYIIDYATLNTKYKTKNNVNIKLNYGKGNKEGAIDGNISKDLYIVNNKTRTVYYIQGYTYGGIKYYRYQEPYTEINENQVNEINEVN